MIIFYQEYISRRDLINNRDFLFVFGDNDERSGYGGQAASMRGETNAIGIRVKKQAAMLPGSFYSDEEYAENIRKIKEDIDKIFDEVKFHRYQGIVFPSSGIGTGMAQLSARAPDTDSYLTLTLQARGIQNGV